MPAVDVRLVITDPDSPRDEVRSNEDFHPLFSLSPISSSDDHFIFPVDASGYISPKRRLSDASTPSSVSSECTRSEAMASEKDQIELLATFWARNIETLSSAKRLQLVALIASQMPQPTALDVRESVDMLGWM